MESKVANFAKVFFEFLMDLLTAMKPSLVWAWLFKINHVNRCRFNFLALNVFNIYPCLNECFAFDNRVFRSCDRYLNSGANLLKLTKVVWLYLVNYYCFHSLKLYKVCNIYPRSIETYLE